MLPRRRSPPVMASLFSLLGFLDRNSFIPLLFRRSPLRPGFRHTSATYHTALLIAAFSRRFPHAESLIDEILSSAAGPPDPPLQCCHPLLFSRRHLFSIAFNLFKRMQQPRPTATAETYSMLLAAILRRFGKPPVSFVYLCVVRSLIREMKYSGVILDTLTVNNLIKVFVQCLEMDEVVRIFKEMELYGWYLAKGLCEKGRIDDGIGYFKEMRGKGLVPMAMMYSVVVCSFVMEGRFEEAVEVVFDMLGNRVLPDVLTYWTVLEEMCRAGRADDAF